MTNQQAESQAETIARAEAFIASNPSATFEDYIEHLTAEGRTFHSGILREFLSDHGICFAEDQ